MEGRNNLKFTQDDKKLLIKYIETIKSKKVLINIFKLCFYSYQIMFLSISGEGKKLF